ncbi:DUF862-domain-containing protein [Myriangium duriaei CBS 260.36]|uniref:DUF862-domain-containing protein n=1 Tax=Myriangium duriaei CBS 260.36 TaxID=1168546 RepID=A0A9P4IQK1_9PEZI|nr:DUF862-domain-containing protein [Myriangium duriaei CBS 260.36]
MDVKLYVYDLSRGMARAMSQQFLGTQIDAIYHTAIVVNGVEYFFGQGIQQSRPGATHHGQPMEIVDMGQTQLPPELILEYLESMRSIYTPEAYDLFQNNCNNFSNEFAQFLVGRTIPDHIVSLPKKVLDTPFGQMLKPQLDASMRSITQAPLAPSSNLASSSGTDGTSEGASNGASHGTMNGTTSHSKSGTSAPEHGTVYNITQSNDLDRLLSAGTSSCAVIFFTSSRCAPCKIVYPTYDSLAAEHTRAIFIKIDTDYAPDLASRYSIRATPTFITFLRGSKVEEFSGADPSRLRGAVNMLYTQAFPPHRHATLDVPSLSLASLRPVTFTKVPPLDKLLLKLGPLASSPAVLSMKSFAASRSSTTTPPLPDLTSWTTLLSSASSLEPASLFPLLDLLRCTILDSRVATSLSTTFPPLIAHISSLSSEGTCPYPLRLVTLQLIATLFATQSLVKTLLSSADVLGLTTSSLLHASSPPALRGAAAAVSFNLSAANYRARREEPDKEEPLPSSAQVELAAAIVESFGEENVGKDVGTAGREGDHAALFALGLLVYFADQDGEVLDLCAALGAKGVIEKVKAEGKVESVRKDVVAVLP